MQAPAQHTADGSGRMFDAIAPSYDRLNRWMSLGLDGRWRRALIDTLLPIIEAQRARGEAVRVLDLATGTADVALALARRHPDVQIIGVDPSRQMLALGQHKLEQQQLGARVQLLEGSATELPASIRGVCAATISFGIRNFPERLGALRALFEVLQPGGRLAILELSEPRNGLMAPLARFHVHTLVPLLGSLLSGREAYAYLAQSIAAFLSPDDFMALMRKAGFVNVCVRRLSFGAVHLFVGDKPTST